MRVVVHDYSGHPGQVHLSRELARRGHHVVHQYCASYTTGRGATERRQDDPHSFSVHAVELPQEFARYSPVARIRQEVSYAIRASNAINAAKPDAAILSNVPLLSLTLLVCMLKVRRRPYVFWQQDVYSDAISTVARHKLGRIGSIVGLASRRCERFVARNARAVIPISETFKPQLLAWGVREEKILVVPNWAAIDEMPMLSKSNAWARENGLERTPVVMYAGTLGLKHNPAVLSEIARNAESGARTVVVSQGMGRDWLESNAHDVSGLMLMDYQPYERLPEMLATADILVVLLEQDASQYSVPSKVLNYLCAGRPIVAILPSGNSVARTVAESQAGLVVPPNDVAGAASAVNALLTDATAREQMGRCARRYAETTFDVASVADRFEIALGASSYSIEPSG
ncbi:glycosyltransferase family 4 protein [Mycolicibacterium sp. OfavD-34-C]|nr:glycosyltransferase family 4 protein [Mycolicibacterium sp. OfavD-34-C]